MNRILLALSLSVVAGPLSASDKVEPPKLPPLACEITGPATCEMGKAPKITVKITNNTGKENLLISSLDGSDCKMRHPYAYYEVIGPDGKSAVKQIARCGNTNPLTDKDFVKVPAKGTFSPYTRGFGSAHQLEARNFDQPGKYRIRFHYSTESKNVNEFGEKPNSGRPFPPEIAKMLDRVPRATLASNEIVVEVKKKQ